MRIYRRMSFGDLEGVLNLARESQDAPQWDRSVYEKLLQQDEGAAAYVASANGTVSGFVVVKQVIDLCEIESIVVAHDLRRQGIGGALLNTVIVWARIQGAQRIQLEVRLSNTAALALYESAGFVPEGKRRGYYRNPDEDAVLMGMALDDTPQMTEKSPEK